MNQDVAFALSFTSSDERKQFLERRYGEDSVRVVVFMEKQDNLQREESQNIPVISRQGD